MATVKFFTKGKGQSVSIYIRVREGRKFDLYKTTGLKINSEDFNNKTGKVKQNAGNTDKVNFQKKLNDLEDSIYSAINEEINTVAFNTDWLSKKLELFHDPKKGTESLYLIDVIKRYQNGLETKNNPRTKKPISKLTIKGYDTTISRLERYFENKKALLLHEVDLTFHSDYTKFATNEMNLSINSIGNDFKKIKTVCLDARDKGHEINKQLESRKFNAPTEDTIFTTLNETELNTIFKHKYEQNYLQNACDWLIIGCWTGCRVSDLMKLTNDNVMITPTGQKFIRYTQNKTNKQVDIPMHPTVEEITNRLGGFPRAISDVKLNKYIKEVCKLAGINQLIKGTRQNPKTHIKETGMFQKFELIRSHTMRRSFATNHYNKLSNKIIMRVTGHQTEAQLIRYVGETDNNHLKDFMNVWNNDKQEDENKLKIESKQII